MEMIGYIAIGCLVLWCLALAIGAICGFLKESGAASLAIIVFIIICIAKIFSSSLSWLSWEAILVTIVVCEVTWALFSAKGMGFTNLLSRMCANWSR